MTSCSVAASTFRSQIDAARAIKQGVRRSPPPVRHTSWRFIISGMRTSWIVSSGICAHRTGAIPDEHRIAFLPLDENGQKSTTEQWEAHMVRRTARPFHRNLTELGGGSGNKRLHEAFGWAESTYCFSPVCSSLVTGPRILKDQ